MVFKANRKIGRKLKTKVSFLLLIYLVMPAVSKDTDSSNPTSVSTDSLTIRYCGRVLPATNATYNDIHNMSLKFDNPTNDLIIANRNSDIIILKRVLTQLNVARNYFRENREVIALLYADAKKVMQTKYYHYKWLFSYPLNWYNSHVKKLDKNTKVFILMPVLRDSLLNFSVTLEQMRNFSETQYMSNFTLIKRKTILDELSENLIALLCEVETALLSLSTWQNKPLPGTRTVIIGGPDWDPNPDHTTMQIQDWGVLNLYYRFLKEWKYIIQTLVDDLDVSSSDDTSVGVQARPLVAKNDSRYSAARAGTVIIVLLIVMLVLLVLALRRGNLLTYSAVRTHRANASYANLPIRTY